MWLDLGVLGDGTGIVQGNSLFTCDRDGLRVCLPPSLPELREGMLRVSPEDKAEINRFCNAVELLMATDNIAGEGCDEGVSIGSPPVLLRPLLGRGRGGADQLHHRGCQMPPVL